MFSYLHRMFHDRYALNVSKNSTDSDVLDIINKRKLHKYKMLSLVCNIKMTQVPIMSNLTELHLYCNKNVKNIELESLPNLLLLVIEESNILELSGSKSLLYLYCNNSTSLRKIRNMKKLLSIYADNCTLLTNIENIPDLQVLYCSQTSIQKIDGFPKLKHLYARNCLYLEEIVQINPIRTISVTGSKITTIGFKIPHTFTKLSIKLKQPKPTKQTTKKDKKDKQERSLVIHLEKDLDEDLNDEDQECLICLGTLSDHSYKHKCVAVYHEECITKWYKLHNTCPLCKCV